MGLKKAVQREFGMEKGSAAQRDFGMEQGLVDLCWVAKSAEAKDYLLSEPM